MWEQQFPDIVRTILLFHHSRTEGLKDSFDAVSNPYTLQCTDLVLGNWEAIVETKQVSEMLIDLNHTSTAKTLHNIS